MTTPSKQKKKSGAAQPAPIMETSPSQQVSATLILLRKLGGGGVHNTNAESSESVAIDGDQLRSTKLILSTREKYDAIASRNAMAMKFTSPKRLTFIDQSNGRVATKRPRVDVFNGKPTQPPRQRRKWSVTDQNMSAALPTCLTTVMHSTTHNNNKTLTAAVRFHCSTAVERRRQPNVGDTKLPPDPEKLIHNRHHQCRLRNFWLAYRAQSKHSMAPPQKGRTILTTERHNAIRSQRRARQRASELAIGHRIVALSLSLSHRRERNVRGPSRSLLGHTY